MADFVFTAHVLIMAKLLKITYKPKGNVMFLIKRCSLPWLPGGGCLPLCFMNVRNPPILFLADFINKTSVFNYLANAGSD